MLTKRDIDGADCLIYGQTETNPGKLFRFPTMQRIESAAQKLYAAEERRDRAIKIAAEEQGKILGFAGNQFWTHCVPEQLAATLNAYERGAAEAAAIGFLRSRGYEIQKKAGA